MTRIADLLERDFSRAVEENVKVDNDDPAAVFAELTEYIATDHIRAEYERLFAAMAAAAQSAGEGVGVWISGILGSGKSSFAKNIRYVLANREVRGFSASSLFLKQAGSKRLTESVEFLNRAVPYEIFVVDLPAPADVEQIGVERIGAHQIAEVMYRVMLRELDRAEDLDIAELEMELEREGRIAAFLDLCRGEYNEEWCEIRKGSQKLARSSDLLHRLDPKTYSSTDTWLNVVQSRPSRNPSVRDLVNKIFDQCEISRHGKAFAFILDDIDECADLDGERLRDLRGVVEQFGRESQERLKTGRIPGPAWIIVTAKGKPGEGFKHQIELSTVDIREVATRRVLRKKESQEPILRKLFREHGASLSQNVKLERCSRRTEFDEDQFVRFYPYLPHLIDLSLDIMASIRAHPHSPHAVNSNRTLVKQAFEMLASDRTRLADQPVGVLVSIDKIYELVEANIPQEKQKEILDIRRRFDTHEDYPGLAARVAKAICLMEFARTDLPRTTKNIAALLVQRITEMQPTIPVAELLHHMKEARFVRETEEGWKLYDLDELRRALADLEGRNNALGTLNPRLPGWHNNLIQLFKKLLARMLSWYTRPLYEFNASVSRSLEEVVLAFDRVSTNMVSADQLSSNMAEQDRLSVDMVAIEGRLALSEKRNAALTASMQKQLELLQEQVRALSGLPEAADLKASTGGIESDPYKYAQGDRTAYVIGLFGTGRRYINELIVKNIGERAKYFRDTIRLHPGPTSMIYSGHSTVKHDSRLQYPPSVTSRILEAAGSGFADLIFVYRHPLDSLLTNWVWWRAYIRDNKSISGISQVYAKTDDLCADLERNFFEFEAFARGDPDFFAGVPGPRFLSFGEFVEETELHLQSATLALRLEDFMIDPCREFARIAEVMSVNLDLRRISVARPRTRPYGYLAVQDKVPRFKHFIDGLNKETKGRIGRVGYNLGI